MAIEKVHIKNYKSIKDSEEFQLTPVNIFIGANGSGKTNFISFFNLVRKIYEKNLQVYIAQQGGSGKFLYNGIKGSENIYGEIIFDNEWKNKYKFILSPTTDNNFVLQEWSGHRKDDVMISNGARESQLEQDEQFRNQYLRKFLESLRVFHFHDTSFTSKMRQPALLSDNAYLQADGSNLPVILYKIKQNNSSDYINILSAIKSNLPYLHDFYLEPENNTISLRWKIINQDNIFDAHQLSDGSLRFIALTTLLMQPNPPAIIIIDEPELGLHPYAINQLAQMIHLASQKTQLIISTQSSDLIEAYIANSHHPEKSVEHIIVTEFDDYQTKLKRLNYDELKNWLENYSLKELWDKNIIGGRPKSL